MKVTQLLKTDTSWNGMPITYPTGKPEVTGLIVEIAPPSFAFVMEGALELALINGEVKRLHAGDALAEVVDTLHNGRNAGKTPLKLIVFYTGAVGQPLTSQMP